jgi:glycosyltransferase involved in cell wall biosynthesis
VYQMRILYIVSSLKRCGPTNVLYNIVRRFDQRYDVSILTLAPAGNDSLEQEFIASGCRIINKSRNRWLWPLVGRSDFLDVIHQLDPDIIHSHGLRGDILNGLFGKGVMSFSTIHCFPFEDYLRQYGRLVGSLAAVIQVAMLSRIDWPIACSSAIAKNFANKHNLHPRIVQNGISLPSESANYLPREILRRKLGLDEKPILVVVGSMIPRKDPILVLEAFRRSCRFEDHLLLFLGDGPLLAECKKAAGDNKNIVFAGNVSNVFEYLACASYYISASLSEGLPNSVLEAMGAGVPVILSAIPSHLEILLPDPGAGVTFRPNSCESLVEVLDNLPAFDATALGLRARKLVENNFTDCLMSERYSSYYLEALGQKRDRQYQPKGEADAFSVDVGVWQRKGPVSRCGD